MTDDIQQKIDSFFGQYRLRHYGKGQVLILNGDGTDYIYHLKSGQVKVYDVTYRGDEIILNIFKPPAFFPMSLAINKQWNPYVYEAETDVEVHQAPAGEALDFVRQNPEVMFDLLSRLYRGMDGMMGRMSQLMGGSARSRLMYELILQARRFGTVQEDGTVSLEANERGLGSRSGLSRETVSREMQKLKQAGMIGLQGKRILIYDIEALEGKLGPSLPE